MSSILDAFSAGVTRDYAARHLTLIDFNSFGSTSGFEGRSGVELITYKEIDLAVSAFASRAIATKEFHAAKKAAEARLNDIVDCFLDPDMTEAAMKGGSCACHSVEPAHV